MGDCLYVFSSNVRSGKELEELAECNVSAFCDSSFFQCAIHCYLGADRYPTVTRLLDSDGGFPASEVRALEQEIRQIAATFRKLPSGRIMVAFERVEQAWAAEARVAKARAAKARAARARAEEESVVSTSLCRCAQSKIIDALSNATSFQYSMDDITSTERKLREIAAEFHKLPSDSISAESSTEDGSAARRSLYDCFQNANGDNLFDALLKLCAVAIKHRRPIISE
jgi:hypothetical protein